MKMKPGEPPRLVSLKVNSKAMHRRQATRSDLGLVPIDVSHQGVLANGLKLALPLSIIILVQQLHFTSPLANALSMPDVAEQQRVSDRLHATISESFTVSSIARLNLTAAKIDTQQQIDKALGPISTSSLELAPATSTDSVEWFGQQNNHSASSAPPSQVLNMQFPLYMRIIATFVCLIILTIGVCGNLLVPLVVIKTRYLRNSTNLFLINLSIADLLVLIVCMPTVLIELHSRPETWLLGEAMCKLSNYVEMLAANGSIFTILAISFERYYAICKPLKAGYKCTRLRATVIICFIWLLASILTSPILMMAKSSQTIYIDGSMVYNCILETDTYWPKMYVFVSMFAFFCLPLVVLILVYCLISRRLIRQNIAMMDSSTYDHFDHRHGSMGQTGAVFESHAHRPDAKQISPRQSESLKPFLSLLSNNHVHFKQKEQIQSDRKPSAGQRHPVMADKINSVLISQLNMPKSDKMLAVNKRKSFDCLESKGIDDIFEPNEGADAFLASRSTWLHLNETNSDHLTDIIVNNTDSPKESSLPSNGFFSQLLHHGILRYARGALRHSMADPSKLRRLLGCKPSVTMSASGAESRERNGHASGGSNTPLSAHSKLINAASCPTAVAAAACSTAPETENMFLTDRRDTCGGQVPFSSNRNGSIPSPYTIYCRDRCNHLVIGNVCGKRRLGRKKNQADETKGFRGRSKFRWVKNSSISSATGSTYTNSTFLASETSSKSPSLRKCGHNRATPQSNVIDDKGDSRRASPATADQKRCAHSHDCNKTIDSKSAQAHATISTNSYSFSASCDADNSSENSSSPGCLSTAPDVSKSSWLVSLALREHQFQHQIAHQHLSRLESNAQSNLNSSGNVSGETNDASKAHLNGDNCLFERDFADSRPTSQSSSDGAQNDDLFDNVHSGDYADKCITEERTDEDSKFGRKMANGKRRAKQRIVRSLTDDRPHYGRTKLKPIQSALGSLSEKFNCDSKSAHPTIGHTSKVSLVTLAHNLSDNLNSRYTNRRCGSHPLVTNHLLVNRTSEILAVQDASKKQQMDSRRQVVVMLAFVVACFFLLFFPYRVFTIWLILSTEDQVQSLGMETYYNLTYFSRILIYLHSAINPIAYNLISTKFRRAFMSILLFRGSAARRNFTSDTYRKINVGKICREKAAKPMVPRDHSNHDKCNK